MFFSVARETETFPVYVRDLDVCANRLWSVCSFVVCRALLLKITVHPSITSSHSMLSLSFLLLLSLFFGISHFGKSFSPHCFYTFSIQSHWWSFIKIRIASIQLTTSSIFELKRKCSNSYTYSTSQTIPLKMKMGK